MRNHLRDAPRGIAHDLVAKVECLDERGLGPSDHIEHAVCIDDEEGVDALAHGHGPLDGLTDTRFALSAVWDVDDSDGEDAFFFGFLGDDRSGSGACPSPHSCRHENHFGVRVEHGLDVGHGLDCALAASLRIVAGPETGSENLPELNLPLDGAFLEGLDVGIADDEIDALDVHVDHIVDGVAAGTTYTDYFDDFGLFFFLSGVGQNEIVDYLTISDFFHRD